MSGPFLAPLEARDLARLRRWCREIPQHEVQARCKLSHGAMCAAKSGAPLSIATRGKILIGLASLEGDPFYQALRQSKREG